MIKPRYLAILLALLANPPAHAATEQADLQRLEQLLTVPAWNVTTTLGTGGGYRDNILLSASNPHASGFARGNVEAMFLRASKSGFDSYAFFSLEETRYFSPDATDHERAIFLLAEPRCQATDSWKFSLPVQAYHLDQVMDVSVTEADFNTAELKTTGFTAGPLAHWNFAPAWWTEAKPSVRKDHFKNGIDGYVEYEGMLRIGRDWKYGTVVSLTAASRERNHDTRVQYALGGRPIAGTRLKFRQNEVTARLDWAADEKKTWRAHLAASFEENRDNGSGYFDFNKQSLSTGVTWRSDPWEVEFSAGVDHYNFPQQLVGIGISPDTRHKNDYQASVAATRRLTDAWSVTASYVREDAASNDDRSRFRINTAYLGVKWDWDNLGASGPTR